LREVLKHQHNAQVLLAEVAGFNVANRTVTLKSGEEIGYDTLIVAAGASPTYFGNGQWEGLAPGLKTIEDATEIRRRILLAFETAERASDRDTVQALLTFVIVGAGPTGVELAGAIAELARDTLKHNFRAINPADARIVLLEGTDRVLPCYPTVLSTSAAVALTRLGVSVRTGAMVTDIQPGQVTFQCGAQSESITSRSVLWAAGVQASPLGRLLSEATGAALDRTGRIMVEPDLTLPSSPEIFVIGDLAHFSHQTGTALPGVAPVAMQQGRYVATTVERRLRNQHPSPFRYKDRGSMATIGRAHAVADVGWMHLSGLTAWFAWLFIHLLGLVAFQNRVLVSIQWAWNYFTYNRAARLITGEAPRPVRERTES
jgi:NADH dehydrogenase